MTNHLTTDATTIEQLVRQLKHAEQSVASLEQHVLVLRRTLAAHVTLYLEDAPIDHSETITAWIDDHEITIRWSGSEQIAELRDLPAIN